MDGERRGKVADWAETVVLFVQRSRYNAVKKTPNNATFACLHSTKRRQRNASRCLLLDSMHSESRGVTFTMASTLIFNAA